MQGKCCLCGNIIEGTDRDELDDRFTIHTKKNHILERILEGVKMEIEE